MMRAITFLIFIFLVQASLAQKDIVLKKKYFGKYEGTISAYSYQERNELIHVAETTIKIELFKDAIKIKIGSNEMNGTYNVMFEADDYFLVDASMIGVLATERIIVYKKGKKIGRDGMYPQPVTELVRYARK